MILYNVTINIDPDVEMEWKEWMKTIHIPDVLKTGFFTDHRFLKLLGEQPEATGVTYAVQYFAPSIGHIEKYLNTVAPNLQKEHNERYHNKFVAFRTVLEEV